jgi:uncharacterized RDD family membrane protein YckC
VVIAAPPGYQGATALAYFPAEAFPLEAGGPAANAESYAETGQGMLPMETDNPEPPLFQLPAQKVISFHDVQRQAAARFGTPPPGPTSGQTPAPSVEGRLPSPPRTYQRRAPRPTQEQIRRSQGQLDLQEAEPRKTKTNVVAQIDCDSRVATPLRRFTAGAYDGAMILIGFGLFIGAVEIVGGGFGTGKLFGAAIGLSFALTALFYGLLWVLSDRQTPGMKSTDMRLIRFDGYPPEPRNRVVRFAALWLSFCAGGLGLLWAVADEEKLTWHDHISKTFPSDGHAPAGPPPVPARRS